MCFFERFDNQIMKKVLHFSFHAFHPFVLEFEGEILGSCTLRSGSHLSVFGWVLWRGENGWIGPDLAGSFFWPWNRNFSDLKRWCCS